MTSSDAARRTRVLFVASAGGHWVQLGRLKAAFEGCDIVYVTTRDDYRTDVAGARFHTVSDVTRKNALGLFALSFEVIRILLAERPDVVVTTGAAPGLVAIAWAKVFTRARTIWIDSIANCERLSSSGKQARFFADAWLTQWPDLACPKGPSYWGAVL